MNIREYPVTDRTFNKRISNYLESFVDIRPHIFGQEIIYAFEDGSQITTEPSKEKLGMTIVKAFDCSSEILNNLEKLTGVNLK